MNENSATPKVVAVLIDDYFETTFPQYLVQYEKLQNNTFVHIHGSFFAGSKLFF